MQIYKIKKKTLAIQPDNRATNTCSKSHRRPNYTNAKSKSTDRNHTSITKRLFKSIVSSSKAVRRSKKNETRKLPQNKLRIVYVNARGIKSKMQSLKRIILSKPCYIFALTYKHF